MNVRSVSLLLVLLAALAGSLWLTQHLNTTLRSTRAEGPDAIITQIHFWTTNQDGQLQLDFSSPQLWHYSDGNRAVIKQPRIELQHSVNDHWQLQADQANTSNGTHQIDLQGHVQLHELKTTDAMTLLTEQLTVWPKKEIASNEVANHITRGKLQLDGVGLLANLNQRQFQLLHKVRGNYAFQ